MLFQENIRDSNAVIHIDNPPETTPHIAPANIHDVTSFENTRLRFSPRIRTKKMKQISAIIIPVYAIIVYKDS